MSLQPFNDEECLGALAVVTLINAKLLSGPMGRKRRAILSGVRRLILSLLPDEVNKAPNIFPQRSGRRWWGART